MSRLKAIEAALPEDWPIWAVRIVADEAPVLAANLSSQWAVEEEAVARSLRSLENQFRRSLKNGDLAAEEQWWDRLDAWLDGLDGALGREALTAMNAWSEAEYAKNPRVFHGSPYEFEPKGFKRAAYGLYGPGVYFTDSEQDAEWYATKSGELGYVYSCEVDFRRPLEWHRLFYPTDQTYSSWSKKVAYSEREAEELRRILKSLGPKPGVVKAGDELAEHRASQLLALGFDGIVAHFARSGTRDYPNPNLELVSSPEAATESYYVVLDPAQIEECSVRAVEPRGRMTANGEDHRIEHRPAGKDGAPLWDITQNGVYPDDAYGPMAARYYGVGDGSDSAAWSLVFATRGKPNKMVRIYRAVPKVVSRDEQIADLEAQKRYILKHGKVPKGVVTYQSPSAYYDMISRSLDSLERQLEPEEQVLPIKIGPGDWVTIDRRYAVDHGEAHVGGKGKYKVLSKTVPASSLFTDGNSILEWGYSP